MFWKCAFSIFFTRGFGYVVGSAELPELCNFKIAETVDSRYPSCLIRGWQVSHTKVRRPLITKRLISPSHFGQLAFPKILNFSPYRFFDNCSSNTVMIAFLSTPMASRVLASFQIWSKVCRLIALPGVSGWIAWRHKISERYMLPIPAITD